jgi:hypothetical protein
MTQTAKIIASLQTPTEAASHVGLSAETIRIWAARLGLGARLGGRLLLTPDEVAKIVRESPGVPGRPRKTD